jgi:hypothetical protein
VAKCIVVWYSPGDLVGYFMARVTHSKAAHVGVAITVESAGTLFPGPLTYIDVQPPRIRLLGYIPPGAFTTKTLEVEDEDVAPALDYMAEMNGKPYSYSVVVTDALNAITGTHIEIEAGGECCCSGTVANVLVRLGLLKTTMPDQETPASLLAVLGTDEQSDV